MKVNKKCETCNHAKVCSIKEDFNKIVDIITETVNNDEIKNCNNISDFIKLEINCTEYSKRESSLNGLLSEIMPRPR